MEVGVAGGAPLQVIEDALGEKVDEVDVQVAGLYVELHAASRFMAGLHDAEDMAELVAHGFAHKNIKVYGALILSPEAADDVSLAQQAAVELQVVHAQVGIDSDALINVVDFHTAGGEALELYVVEVDDTEDILEVDAAQVGIEGVGAVLRDASVHAQMAPCLRHLETTYIHDAVMVADL